MKKVVFTADTPLSALFRRTFHDDLRQVINSWRPFLQDCPPDVDALDMSRFILDHRRISSRGVYAQLIALMNRGALRPPMRTLADYLFYHSNLSRSAETLYQTLWRTRRDCKLRDDS